MTDYHPTLADLAAIEDVLHQAINDTESFDLDECVDFRIAADIVRAKAKELMDYCDMQMIRVAEGRTVVRDGTVFEVGDAGHWTFDHDVIWRAAARLAAQPDPETGEVPSVAEAAERAAQMMHEVYVSPSTTAKVTALTAAGVAVEVIREWTGEGTRKVKATPVARLTKKRRRELGLLDERG